MPIPVLLFASLRSRFGPEFQLDSDLPASVESLQERLVAHGIWATGARIAVNQRFASQTDTVEPGDEVAVIPPVSGG